MKPDSKVRVRAQAPRFAAVRSVSQVVLTLRAEDSNKAFADIRHEALKWLANRAGRKLPRRAWEGKSFDMLEAGAQPVAAVALDDSEYWCFRVSDADKDVPQRHWTTEGGVLRNDDQVLFGCRLQCVALGESPDFDASIPGVVAQVAGNHPAYLDERRITLSAWNINSDTDVDALVTLLLDPDRRRPVIAISLGNGDGPAILDVDKLARQTVGAAHVVTLTGEASYELTDRIGKEFSVFRGAVRTYRPELDPDNGLPANHPVALPQTIENWAGGGAESFARFLVEGALRDTVLGVDIYRELPSFADIHAQAVRRRRDRAKEAGASDADLLTLALEENESLEDKLREEQETYEGLLQAAELDRRQIESALAEVRSDYRGLQARLEWLEGALRAAGKQEEAPIPESFDALETWCADHLSGHVQVLPRAIRAAAKSSFETPSLAYRALLILRDQFVPMKREGGLEKKQAYERSLAELGLEDTPSFSAERAGEFGDEYRVVYNGRPHRLERHLKGSNSREERFGFRLYFFWDDDTRQAVVGWFPSHLTTRAS